MPFEIKKLNQRPKYLPEGFYILKDAIEYRIEDLTISAAGNVCLKYRDPKRGETGVITICKIEELVQSIDGLEFREY